MRLASNQLCKTRDALQKRLYCHTLRPYSCTAPTSPKLGPARFTPLPRCSTRSPDEWRAAEGTNQANSAWSHPPAALLVFQSMVLLDPVEEGLPLDLRIGLAPFAVPPASAAEEMRQSALHLYKHGVQVLLARRDVALQVLVHPLEDQPQLLIVVHAVLRCDCSAAFRTLLQLVLCFMIRARKSYMRGRSEGWCSR